MAEWLTDWLNNWMKQGEKTSRCMYVCMDVREGRAEGEHTMISFCTQTSMVQLWEFITGSSNVCGFGFCLISHSFLWIHLKTRKMGATKKCLHTWWVNKATRLTFLFNGKRNTRNTVLYEWNECKEGKTAQGSESGHFKSTNFLQKQKPISNGSANGGIFFILLNNSSCSTMMVLCYNGINVDNGYLFDTWNNSNEKCSCHLLLLFSATRPKIEWNLESRHEISVQPTNQLSWSDFF